MSWATCDPPASDPNVGKYPERFYGGVGNILRVEIEGTAEVLADLNASNVLSDQPIADIHRLTAPLRTTTLLIAATKSKREREGENDDVSSNHRKLVATFSQTQALMGMVHSSLNPPVITDVVSAVASGSLSKADRLKALSTVLSTNQSSTAHREAEALFADGCEFLSAQH